MNVEQRIENDRLNLKITFLETSLKNLAIAARHLATEADEWLNHTDDCDAGVLEGAINKVNDLASGIH